MPFSFIAGPDTSPEQLVDRVFQVIEGLEPQANFNIEVVGGYDSGGRYRLRVFILFPHMSYKKNQNCRTSAMQSLVQTPYIKKAYSHEVECSSMISDQEEHAKPSDLPVCEPLQLRCRPRPRKNRHC